jgi:TPP-dependent pyruvate/acetoin dehydrogenase alpha subunit
VQGFMTGSNGGSAGAVGAAADTRALPSLEHYRWMSLCRILESTLCTITPRWFPAEGEEATIVGSFCDLTPHDVVAPHYRGPFVVYLMRGAELWRLVAQVLGKAAGYNRGRSVPFSGPIEGNAVPWVAGDLGTTIGVATGAAFALQSRETQDVVVCSFGDGSSNRGDFHEAINLAAVWKLPIVYVCQNNGWAISQRARDYLQAPVAARAAGYGIPGTTVDGQDLAAVRAAVADAVQRARLGQGPSLVEALTVRFRGHWAGDSGLYRASGEDVAARDPLDVLRAHLLEIGVAAEGDFDAVDAEQRVLVDSAIDRARALPDISQADLGRDGVYVP